MIELAIVSLLWLALLVTVARAGTRHLQRPWLPTVTMLATALSAALGEALPFTAVSPGFTLRTLIATVAGVFAGRLLARAMTGWAHWQEKTAEEAEKKAIDEGTLPPPRRRPRLVHPLIAVGLGVAGLPLLHNVVTANHENLEVLTTPRDPKTGIVRCAEDVLLQGNSGHAVLLVHGFLSSPTDFADLALRLHERGLTVRVLRLPGHGLTPGALETTTADDLVKAVREAREELSASHETVSLVGFSMGATLAALEAAERPVASLVLVNPYLGELVTPWWCPISVEALTPITSRFTQRVMCPESLRGVDRREGLAAMRMYRTLPLAPVLEVEDLARRLEALDAPHRIDAPTLLLSGDLDRVVPGERARDWFGKFATARSRVVRFERSDHRLYRDWDGEEAVRLTVVWTLGGAR